MDIEDIIKKNSILYFDIGSNIGNWSLANINQCNKIISIENDFTNFLGRVDTVIDYFFIVNSDQ